MAEYIDKELILKKAVEFPGCFSKMVSAYDIAHMTAADVAEVRHGRWNPEICESISKRNRLIEYKVYSCSLCGRSNGRVKKKYCPNCGALMKEDEYEAD